MRFSNVVAASVVVPLVVADGAGMPRAPKIFDMPKHMKARNPWMSHWEIATPVHRPRLQIRQGGSSEGRCGAQGGGASCATGYCCSIEGYCGNSEDYCAAPDCQFNFGLGCDANKTPAGASTRNDARTQLGSIVYGGLGIRECLKPKTVAITYDDGPYIYTERVIAQFEARNAHATFFITGNNNGKGAIDEKWRSVITDMYNKGHQVASHTWSHQDLSIITQEQRYDQMVKNEMAIRNIIGRYPTYMRPPYSSCNDACQAVLADLGYVVTYFDLDTDDYNQLTKEKIQTAKDNFKDGIDTAGLTGERLTIAHDIHELTALNLTGYMLDYVYSKGLTAVTVGECMNDPPANWYRDSTPAAPGLSHGGSSSPVPMPTGATSINGACGTLNVAGSGQSCIGFVGPEGLSECCSQYGWCGNSAEHCGSDCNLIYGKCDLQPGISSSVSGSRNGSTFASASRTSSSPQATVTLATSLTGECGAIVGRTCIGFVHNGAKAGCCSPYNYCGNTAEHCGTGCDPLYGMCEGGSSLNSSSPLASTSIVASTSSSCSERPSLAITSSSLTRSAAPVTTSLSIVSSTIATSVRPSTTVSQPSITTPIVTPAKTPISSNGRCGADYGGQTCAGYTNWWGWKIECCSTILGWCSNDPWGCGLGCDKGYGKCWFQSVGGNVF